MTEPPAGNPESPQVEYTPPPPFAPAAGPQQWPGYAYPPPAYYPPGAGYGYPPYGYPRPTRPRLSFGAVAAGIGGAGFLLIAIALLALPWFSVGGGLTASDVRGLLADRGDIANDLSVAYFSWFGWFLALMSLGCALVAAVPRYGLSLAFRIAGPIVAGFAVLFTVGAIELTDTVYTDDTYYFAHLSGGFWIALIGFAMVGTGCIIGPRQHGDGPVAGTYTPAPGTFQP